MMNQADICIVGAGVAGCAMAAYLADHGFKVTVVERSLAEQDRIVGELMQPGGVEKLKAMGLAHLLQGFDAQEITGYALFLRDKHISITYPEGERGRGLRNGKFMQQERSYIVSHTNITVLEGSVTSLIEEEDKVKGLTYIPIGLEESVQIFAPLTIVCDGMFSGFRPTLSDSEKTISSYFLGMILRDCELPFAGHGHVIVAEPSPVLCYPISNSETRILIDFPGSVAPRRGEELNAFLNDKIGPQLPQSIQSSFYAAVAEGKMKVMPNHLCTAKPKMKSGAVLIGDSLNMRHPLTGGGMTVAMTDIHHLGQRLIAIQQEFTITNINAAVAEFYSQRHLENGAVNILADALYGVMSDEDLKEACYTYLERGGDCANIPLSLLSALNRDKDLLLQHFFAVALHGAKNLLFPIPSPSGIKRSFKMMKNAIHIVSPLILNEKPGIFTTAAIKVAEKVF